MAPKIENEKQPIPAEKMRDFTCEFLETIGREFVDLDLRDPYEPLPTRHFITAGLKQPHFKIGGI